MDFVTHFKDALLASLSMLWSIIWALVLGFTLSGMLQTFVSRQKMASLLGRAGAKQIARASFFGAMSSSCSYAAASMSRSLFERGANIIPALAFMLASTNLVIELGVVLWVLMGWQFVAAEFLGGMILVSVMSLLMLAVGPLKSFEAKQRELSSRAGEEADEESADVRSKDGWIRAARASWMELQMIWKDILIGVSVSGFLMVFVPVSFWQSLFLGAGNSGDAVKLVENALVGPLVSMLSFVCSVGNVPLASALYHGGISFGGSISFIFADLIVIPLILIYRKYYGWKLTLAIVGVFYFAMAVSGIVVEVLFKTLGILPASVGMAHETRSVGFQFNSTFWLNLVAAAVTGILCWLSKQAPKEEHSCCH